jgi:transposase-like protein
MPNVEAAENRRRGRPALLNRELADEIVAHLAAGATLGEAARACGVGPRTLRAWRKRAWSPRAADRPFIALEKRIQRALPKGAQLRSALEPWEAAAAALEIEHPERWAVSDVDDVLPELD